MVQCRSLPTSRTRVEALQPSSCVSSLGPFSALTQSEIDYCSRAGWQLYVNLAFAIMDLLSAASSVAASSSPSSSSPLGKIDAPSKRSVGSRRQDAEHLIDLAIESHISRINKYGCNNVGEDESFLQILERSVGSISAGGEIYREFNRSMVISSPITGID
ncbi:hypothetical protein VTN00DRAFT_7187 [Thermoascus crustaceus]|uniref:uncharacterized protein n=1 Tax=Thermoascus crustaceus TaxID=5088 RepID=UPI0037442E2E